MVEKSEHCGRGLTKQEYDRARRAGTLHLHARTTRSREEFADAWELIDGAKLTAREIGFRMGLSMEAVQKQLERCRRAGLIPPRVV